MANKDKILNLEAIGYADVSGSRPLLIDAIFWIASMSKPITAAALMILVDEGKVKLDDPVKVVALLSLEGCHRRINPNRDE